MSRTPHLLAFLAVCAALASGCLPSGEDANKAASGAVEVQATQGQLVDEIKKMSATPEAYGDKPDRHILARQLGEMGPTAMAPLVDFMGAPDVDPQSRLFVLQCIAPYLSVVYMPNIKPLLESQDSVVRAIGVTAVGHIKDPASVQLLTFARKDPSENVSFSALSGLAMQGDPLARQEMRQMYTTSTTIGAIPIEAVKREVVRVLLIDATNDDLSVLKDALNQPYLAPNARFMIADTLGRLGSTSDIPLLEQSLSLQTEPEYGEMVKQAIASINERLNKA